MNIQVQKGDNVLQVAGKGLHDVTKMEDIWKVLFLIYSHLRKPSSDWYHHPHVTEEGLYLREVKWMSHSHIRSDSTATYILILFV